jgi:hypothetical protein
MTFEPVSYEGVVGRLLDRAVELQAQVIKLEMELDALRLALHEAEQRATQLAGELHRLQYRTGDSELRENRQ